MNKKPNTQRNPISKLQAEVPIHLSEENNNEISKKINDQNLNQIQDKISQTENLLSSIKKDLSLIKINNSDHTGSCTNLVYTELIKFINSTRHNLIAKADNQQEDATSSFKTAFEDFDRKMNFILKQYDFQAKALNKSPIIQGYQHASSTPEVTLDKKVVQNSSVQCDMYNLREGNIVEIFSKSENPITQKQFSDYFIYENDSNLYFGLGKINKKRDGNIYQISKSEKDFFISQCRPIGDNLKNLESQSWSVNDKKIQFYAGFNNEHNREPNHMLQSFDGRQMKRLDNHINLPPVYKSKIQVTKLFSRKQKDYAEQMWMQGGKCKQEWREKHIDTANVEWKNGRHYQPSIQCYDFKSRMVFKQPLNIQGRTRHLFSHMSNGAFMLGFGKKHSMIFCDLQIYKSTLDHLVRQEIENLPKVQSVSQCKSNQDLIIQGGSEGFLATVNLQGYTEFKWTTGWKYRSRNGWVAWYDHKLQAFKDLLNDRIREIEYQDDLKGILGVI